MSAKKRPAMPAESAALTLEGKPAGPYYRADWLDTVYANLETALTMDLEHLINFARLMTLIKDMKFAETIRLANQFGALLVERQPELEAAASQCKRWREQLAADRKMQQAIIDAGIVDPDFRDNVRH